MIRKAFHFHPRSLLFLLAALLALCPAPTRGESFSCAKIFRDKYSMFLFKSPSFLVNIADMVFTYKQVPMQGSLYFNMCGMSTIRDICGDEPVTGKFVFVNKSGIPGTPTCLVMNEETEDSWSFSHFAKDSQAVNLEGVKIQNSKLAVEAVGGIAEAIDQVLQEKQHQLMDGLDRMGMPESVQHNLFEMAADHLKIDSEPRKSSKFRLLAKNKQAGSQIKASDTKTDPVSSIEIIDIDEAQTQIKAQVNNAIQQIVHPAEQATQISSTLQIPSSKRTPQFLTPTPKPNHSPGFDVIEEGNAIKRLIEKKLQQEIQKKMQDSETKNSQSQIGKSKTQFRLLSGDKTTPENAISNQVAKAFDAEIESEFNFYCDSGEPRLMTHFLPNQNLLEINVYSSDGCMVNFEFLQLLNEIPWLTGTIFLILGVGLALFGIKVYRNLLIVFIPMMIAILGFYLYFALVENKSTSTTKILTLVGLLVFIFIIAVLMVWFNWLIYLIIAFGVSCQFGLLAHSFLAESVGFFTRPYTEWILIVLFFVLFTIMYIVAKDYFVVLSTAVMGSMFVILSLKYFGVTKFDLLFDCQIDKFSDFQNLDTEVQYMCFAFLGVLIFGTIVQIVLLKRQQKQEEAADQAKTHDLHHDSSKNLNIQLENI